MAVYNYSLWLEPSGKLQERLRSEIKFLSDEVPNASKPFDPHVTLIGAVQGTEEEVIAKVRDLAAAHEPFFISFKDVAYGSIYYQTVYLLANETAPLMEIGAHARQAFGWTGPKAKYMPHLSLVYADIPEAERVAVSDKARARLYGEGSDLSLLLPENSFKVGAISLWLTDPDDLSTASWKSVANIPLGKKQ